VGSILREETGVDPQVAAFQTLCQQYSGEFLGRQV
jgi:hypothetical protein